MRIRRLILWRHGRTEWNADARFQGHTDPPLDSLGAEQAAVAASILAMERPDAIFTSDLTRASTTASALAAITGLEVTADQRLRETSLGRWEGLTRDEVEVKFPQELADWQAGVPIRRGGGETAVEVADRATEFLDSIANTAGETVVLVAHGGTHKALAGRLLGLDPADWYKIAPLANCHWTELRQDAAGSWRLHRHNVGPLGAVHTPTEDAAESTPNVDSDEADAEPESQSGSASSGDADRREPVAAAAVRRVVSSRAADAAPVPRTADPGGQRVGADPVVIESPTGWPDAPSRWRAAPRQSTSIGKEVAGPPVTEPKVAGTASTATASPATSGQAPAESNSGGLPVEPGLATLPAGSARAAQPATSAQATQPVESGAVAPPAESAPAPAPDTPADAAPAPVPAPATLTREQVAGAYRYEQLRGHIPGPDVQPDE